MHTRPRAQRAPGISCALFFSRVVHATTRARLRREDMDACLNQRRHCEERKRRRNPFLLSLCGEMDCFASLAMTGQANQLFEIGSIHLVPDQRAQRAPIRKPYRGICRQGSVVDALRKQPRPVVMGPGFRRDDVWRERGDNPKWDLSPSPPSCARRDARRRCTPADATRRHWRASRPLARASASHLSPRAPRSADPAPGYS